MIKYSQFTLNKNIVLSGVGLHTGQKAAMRLIPSEVNSGIVFKRTDLKLNNRIEANYKNVTTTKLCTTIQNQFGISVSTIEHLMAAIYGEGLDNLIIEINAPEVPIMDGSAIDFVKSIRSAGLKKQNHSRKYIKVLNTVEVTDGKKNISIKPLNNSFEIDFELVYDNQLINTQRNKINIYNEDLEYIYNSRTFCLHEDIEKIKKIGLAKGGSLENAVVVKGDKILNAEGLRYKDEFVKHKILDCLGDMLLSGNRLFASITCSQGGHQLTHQLLVKLFSKNQNWEFVTFEEKKSNYNDNIYQKPIAVGA